MSNLIGIFERWRAVLICLGLSGSTVFAWDYENHRVVNQLALASLPTNFPAFVQATAAAERIAFLSGEPDRWRNTPDLALKHLNNPEHYMDVEELSEYGLRPDSLPVFRYEFVAHLALKRAAHPDRFKPLESSDDQDKTQQLVGLLPWGITEHYGKLKSGFSYLKAYQENGGSETEIANAEANIIYIMGVMGHLVGDASQPLHTTRHHHGWVGHNPNGYTTNRNFHRWIDGGYFEKVGGPDLTSLRMKLRPARLVELEGQAAKPSRIFEGTMQYLLKQHQLVEPLYRLEKEGRLSGNGTKGLEGKTFLEQQLLVAGQMLGDLYFSAWQQATPDTFLIGQLKKRSKEGR